MDIIKINELGQMLYKASVTRVPLMPYTSVYPDVSYEEAYRIQCATVEQYLMSGYTISGKKLGYTNPIMQKKLGLSEPSYGCLFAESQYCSGQTVPFDRFIQPGIEAELAFVMKHDLDSCSITVKELLSSVDYVTAALEIVDSRQVRQNRTSRDSIGDNASFGAYVMGDSYVSCSDVDFENISATLIKNGEVLETGTGRSVMGSPVNSLLWLANKLVTHGLQLRKGDVVISGSLVPMVMAQRGESFRASFDTLGEVSVSFE